jgi:hypothetical protein
MLIFCPIIASKSVKTNLNIQSESTSDEEIEVRVALFTDEKEDEGFYSPYRRTHYFIRALRDETLKKGYTWKVENKTYRFVVDFLTSKDLRKGELTKENFDVILYPPDTFDDKVFRFGYLPMQPLYMLERKRIENFIKDGGGYFGTCAGAVLTGEMENEPDTFVEYLWSNLFLGVSAVNANINQRLTLFYQLFGIKPEALGPMMAYLFYSGWNQSDYDVNYHTGVCLDIPVFREHAIFDDYLEDTRRIRWIGGSDLVVSEDDGRKIDILARFPEQEISDNTSTQIHYWKYAGGLRGLIKGMLYKGGDIHYFEHLGILLKLNCFSGDWDRTHKLVETNFSNKPFMTADIYPNRNAGRIVRSTGHLEHNVWFDGEIEDVFDDYDNNQYEGFYRWKNITHEDETVLDEFSYNHWIIRRSIAWVAKVPDSDLPPVYGTSEVCDIKPEDVQSTNFVINCNCKSDARVTNLDLFYRFSTDEESWTEWLFHSTDNDGSDGWSWEFDSPQGSGHYEFYSIRNVFFEVFSETESAPPGPDSAVYIT